MDSIPLRREDRNAELARDIVAVDLVAHPDYSLLLVGHSLDGSVAVLLGTTWEDTFSNSTACMHMVLRACHPPTVIVEPQLFPYLFTFLDHLKSM
jgi:pimeloyl-ACP methyl ester carboxylesterase